MQQNKIYSFCPEATFIDFKQNGECRIFHNDCAVLDAGNGFRVIAERGFPGAIGASFADVLDLTPKARKKLNEFLLCEPSVLLLPNGDSSVFFFSDWYFSTGLLLAVRLSQKESVLRKIINNNARSSGFSLFPASDPLESSPASTAAETVNELFYYAQRIFSQELTCTPLTQAHLLANLAGCRLEQLDLPYDPPFHTKLQRDRFSAFLLCVFLALRQTGGATSAVQSAENVGKVQNKKSGEQVLDFAFSVTQRDVSKEVTAFDLPSAPTVNHRFVFPFMELPCFQSIELSQTDGVLSFNVTSERLEPTLFTRDFAPLPFKIYFTLRQIPPTG